MEGAAGESRIQGHRLEYNRHHSPANSLFANLKRTEMKVVLSPYARMSLNRYFEILHCVQDDNKGTRIIQHAQDDSFKNKLFLDIKVSDTFSFERLIFCRTGGDIRTGSFPFSA
jgi:hypothetical protein